MFLMASPRSPPPYTYISQSQKKKERRRKKPLFLYIYKYIFTTIVHSGSIFSRLQHLLERRTEKKRKHHQQKHGFFFFMFHVFFNSLMMLFFLFMIMNAPPLKASRDFKVGDDSGWVEPDINNVTLYNQWAGKNRFQVGDSLVFEYSNDSVLVVDKWGYYHCDDSKPIIAFNNGNSTVKLNRPGLFYFISGASDHCKKGQRMIVDVMSPRSPHSANAPSGSYSAPSPFPSHSSGDSVSVTCSSLVMALILVANIASLA